MMETLMVLFISLFVATKRDLKRIKCRMKIISSNEFEVLNAKKNPKANMCNINLRI